MICNLNLEDTTYRDFYNRFEEHTTDPDNRDMIVAKEIHFLLCESCFWCASCLNITKTVTRCPSCSDARLESMSISDNEIYKFGYDPARGVTLEFSKSDGVDRTRG
ncbi:MAG: hypothetical protein M3Y53_01365 [Thermoproteota archaeon]|nr:hypothetical protein [Thermoproteota archaeon]